MERRLQTMFPSAIQITEVDRARHLNRRLLRQIGNLRETTPNGRPDSWTSTVYTTLNTADQLHLMPEFKAFHEIVLEEAARFAESLNINHRDYPLRITDCWFNIYGPKDGQEIHQHANNILSGSYYVKAPEGCSGIMFHSERADLMLVPPLTAVNEFNESILEIPVREGMMVLFLSSQKHSVRPSPTADERISISFNIAM